MLYIIKSDELFDSGIMLIQFRVENYKSFDDEQTLSMVAGATKNNSDHVYDAGGVKTLKTAVLFGSNASGKSNIVRAMAVAKNLVIFAIPIPKNDYCRITESNAKRGTSFEFTVSIGKSKYVYGFEILLSNGEIQSEWFYDVTKGGEETKIFERKKGNIISDLKMNKQDEMYFKVYSEESKNAKTTPFLSILSRVPSNERSSLQSVHLMIRWLANSLRIVMAGGATGFNFTKRRDNLSKAVLPAYGTGVSDIVYEELDNNSNPIPPDVIYNVARNLVNQMTAKGEPCGIIDGGNLGKFPIFIGKDGMPLVKKMMFDHNGVLFDYYEESDGTNRLFDLAPLLDPTDDKELVYVIDELDRSLHPQITKKFVSDFERLNPSCLRQLIITSHESRLMDLSLLRRDEIWFIEKNDGKSTLYSLEEFNERTDRRIDKAYLDGRYGAVPCFEETSHDPK